MQIRIPLLGAVAALAGAVSAAEASTIHYIFGGVCGVEPCTLGGASFVGPFTLTLVGDTAAVDTTDPLMLTNVASEADFATGSLHATLTGVSYVFASPTGPAGFPIPTVGLHQSLSATGAVIEGDPTFLNYDLASAFPLTVAAQPFDPLEPRTFFTSAGDLVLNLAEVREFRAEVVPEPDTWVTMLLGLFGLGAAIRGRRRKQAAGDGLPGCARGPEARPRHAAA